MIFDHVKDSLLIFLDELAESTELIDLWNLCLSNSIIASMFTCKVFIISSWVLSLIYENYSFVDRLWSITPFVYSLIYWIYNPTEPGLMVTYLIFCWGSRLTFNFWRKGGYHFDSEDYRWQIVKKLIGNDWKWDLFNLLFIHFYQHFLLWSISLPVYVVTLRNDLTFQDSCLFIVFIVFLILETIAGVYLLTCRSRAMGFSTNEAASQNQ